MTPTAARVTITRPYVSIVAMQVCAVDDATDEEILRVCNAENRSGTMNGWVRVHRALTEDGFLTNPDSLPKPCATTSGRTHFLVIC